VICHMRHRNEQLLPLPRRYPRTMIDGTEALPIIKRAFRSDAHSIPPHIQMRRGVSFSGNPFQRQSSFKSLHSGQVFTRASL
jgi:hypothetical protein